MVLQSHRLQQISKLEAWIPWTWMRRSRRVGKMSPKLELFGSMDFEAWIPWTWMRRSRLGGLMRAKFEAWIPKLGFRGRGCYEAGLEV